MKERYRDIWVRSADGLRLHARSYGDDEAPCVIGLPGLARHAGDFHDLATALAGPEAEAPRHVLAIDYRGRGLSDRDPDPARYDPRVETEDLLRLLDEIGIREACFVGTSRGGIVTMLAAASRPGLVRGAVLNDIGPVIERAGLLRIKGYVGRLAQPRDLAEAAGHLEALFGAQFPNLTERDWRAWAAATWDETPTGLALTYDPALARTLDALGPDAEIPELWPLFEALKAAPLLVVRGGLSDLLSAETAAAMLDAHPDADLVTVADQGHAPLLRGEAIVAPIRRFVDRVLS